MNCGGITASTTAVCCATEKLFAKCQAKFSAWAVRTDGADFGLSAASAVPDRHAQAPGTQERAIRPQQPRAPWFTARNAHFRPSTGQNCLSRLVTWSATSPQLRAVARPGNTCLLFYVVLVGTPHMPPNGHCGAQAVRSVHASPALGSPVPPRCAALCDARSPQQGCWAQSFLKRVREMNENSAVVE